MSEKRLVQTVTQPTDRVCFGSDRTAASHASHSGQGGALNRGTTSNRWGEIPPQQQQQQLLSHSLSLCFHFLLAHPSLIVLSLRV